MITVYSDVNYGGPSLNISSDTPDLRTNGAQWNDSITAVKVPAGTVVTLYEHINFAGQSIVLTADAPDLRVFPGPGNDGTWNDAASSIKLTGSTSERLKLNDKYVECNASGGIAQTLTKSDYGKVKITHHDDKHYDVLFTQTNKTLSVQPDGSLQSRPAGTWGGYEQLVAADQPEPSGISTLMRIDHGIIVGGTVLQIVEE